MADSSPTPFRQHRTPRPVASLVIDSPAWCAARVMARVADIARRRTCCCYVFVRGDLVYVLSEDNAIAHAWALRYTEDWMGVYGLHADLGLIAADLDEMQRR